MNRFLIFFSYVIGFYSKILPFDLFLVKPNTQKEITIYEGGYFNDLFDENTFPSPQSCKPYTTLIASPNNNNSTVSIILRNPTLLTQDIKSANYKLKNSQANIQIIFKLQRGQTNVQPEESAEYEIKHICNEEISHKTENYWSPIEVTFTFSDKTQITVFYIFNCEQKLSYIHFDWSLFILITYSTIIVALLSRFGKIYSIKLQIFKDEFSTIFFQGFSLNFWFFISYVIIVFLVGLCVKLYPKQMQVPTFVIILFLGFFSTSFMINELLCLLPMNFGFQNKLFTTIRFCDLISLVLSFCINTLYFELRKQWIINDIISTAIIGTSLKIFKITSLRTATMILIPCALLDISSAILNQIVSSENYNNQVLKYFNYPIELQLPLFEYQIDKKCTWISILSIILPGLVLSYTLRYDLSKNTRIYRISAVIGLLTGLTFWIFIQIWTSLIWPMSIFTYIIMLLITSIWAQKRGEWKIIWQGNFYDVILMDPFHMGSKSSSMFESLLNEKVFPEEPDRFVLSDYIYRNKDTQKNQSKYKLDRVFFEGLSLIRHKTSLQEANELQDQEEDQLNQNK